MQLGAAEISPSPPLALQCVCENFHEIKLTALAIHKPIHKLLISAGGSCSSRLTVTWALIKIAHKYWRGRSSSQPEYVKYSEIDVWSIPLILNTPNSPPRLRLSPINSLIVFTVVGWMMVARKLELSTKFRGIFHNFRRLVATFNKEKALVSIGHLQVFWKLPRKFVDSSTGNTASCS